MTLAWIRFLKLTFLVSSLKVFIQRVHCWVFALFLLFVDFNWNHLVYSDTKKGHLRSEAVRRNYLNLFDWLGLANVETFNPLLPKKSLTLSVTFIIKFLFTVSVVSNICCFECYMCYQMYKIDMKYSMLNEFFFWCVWFKWYIMFSFPEPVGWSNTVSHKLHLAWRSDCLDLGVNSKNFHVQDLLSLFFLRFSFFIFWPKIFFVVLRHVVSNHEIGSSSFLENKMSGERTNAVNINKGIECSRRKCLFHILTGLSKYSKNSLLIRLCRTQQMFVAKVNWWGKLVKNHYFSTKFWLNE